MEERRPYRGRRSWKDRFWEAAAVVTVFAGGALALWLMAAAVYLLIGPWR